MFTLNTHLALVEPDPATVARVLGAANEVVNALLAYPTHHQAKILEGAVLDVYVEGHKKISISLITEVRLRLKIQNVGTRILKVYHHQCSLPEHVVPHPTFISNKESPGRVPAHEIFEDFFEKPTLTTA